ncbi:MAG TPA: hypothetical protein V6C97_02695 [Oculatellaceae cyanobacterium]
MSVSQDELMYLQSQLEGLESIFLELMPFGVELKRQQVQDYYDKRFDSATKPVASVAENELRRQFNTKANQVRNLVDSAESLGDAGNRLNLIRAAASLPAERTKPLKGNVQQFCKDLIFSNKVIGDSLNEIMANTEIGQVEARVLLASTMFIIAEEVDHDGAPMPVKDLLTQFIGYIRSERLLARNDPFLGEALCALEAMKDESDEEE